MKPLWPSNDVLATNLRRMKRKRKQEVSGGKKGVRDIVKKLGREKRRAEGYTQFYWTHA